MMYNARAVALLLSSMVATLVIAFLALMQTFDESVLISTFIITFSSTFLLVYISLEFLIFREINKIYVVLDKIKKKEKDSGIHKGKDHKVDNNKSKKKRIHEEIFTYVTQKQQEVDQLKKLEIFRREFLADISHELKTPIFAAQGFIHTLLDGAMDDKNVREKFLQKAAKSMDGLQQLVEHLLTLSQLETGELKMHYEEVEINSLVKEIFDDLEHKAKKRHIQFKLNSNNEKGLHIQADRFRMQHAISNLIDNAIKYGKDEGKVMVDLDQDKDSVTVSVRDDGPGIPPEHLKRIFERFYRIEKSRSKDGGGSGLGLAIVQQIIEAHQSKVMVTSKVGKGTTFAFRLKKAGKHEKHQ